MRIGWRRLGARLLVVATATGGIALLPVVRASAFTTCAPGCPITAVDDSYTTPFGTTLDVEDVTKGFMANDSGPSTTNVDLADSDTSSLYGNATIRYLGSGKFKYIPDPHTPFSGDDTFDYRLQDPAGDSDFATVTVTVTPIVRDDGYTTGYNTPLSVGAPGIFANDVRASFDSVFDNSSPSHGTLSLNTDTGAFVYTPAHNYSGNDSFTYTVEDLNFDNAYTQTVHLRVLPPPKGYWMVGQSGIVYPFGQVKSYGDASTLFVTHIEPTPSKLGYWIVNAAGQVSAFGDARSFGNGGTLRAGEIVSSLSSTVDGGGYWLFTNRGRVIPRGNAHFFGDMSAVPLNGPVVGSVATPTAKGYFMVASDGGIFTFGDAVFRGSMGGKPLNKPVNGLVPTADNKGYWLVASDGGIFTFGDAVFRGSMGGRPLNRPIIGMVRYGDGYLMVASDGGIFDFSNLPFLGSLGANPPAVPIAGVAAGG